MTIKLLATDKIAISYFHFLLIKNGLHYVIIVTCYGPN